MKYSIEVNDSQAKLLADALDLYLRVRLGQFEGVIDPWLFAQRHGGGEPTPEQVHEARLLLDQAKWVLTGFNSSASWGIAADEVPDSARVAADLKQVIVHRLAWDKNPAGGHTVNFHEPMKWGKQPLAKMTKVEGDSEP